MTRILFVDDEPRLLAGMQRMMRPYRAEWSVDVAVGGEAAMALVGEQPFDVVVSDMRMPGMDGVELLTRVRERCPGVARFVLSGQTELDVAVRAVSIAHQFLCKPCGADALFALLERARTGLRRLGDAGLRDRVVAMGALPCRPASSRALRALVERAEPPLDLVAHVIASDTAMAAKALQLAGSSLLGQTRRALDPREAVTLLGSSLMRELVLKTSIFAAAERPQDDDAPTSVSFAERVGRLAARASGSVSTLPASELGEALLGLWGVAA